MLKNSADAEDAVQSVFMKLFMKVPQFESDEHEKAWLIRVATNKCRDMLRYRKRHITEPESALDTLVQNTESSLILEALMSLPDKFRIVLTLHYIDGYKVEEIAKMIDKSASAVKMRLQKGRKLLEEAYRKESVL
jgi:RNA polymerase sigma-70 factor (ECF subfamily)